MIKCKIGIGLLAVVIIIEVIYILITRIEKQKQIKDIFSIDILTGIGNNAKFIDDTSRILKENSNKEYIIAIIDIKKFKYINYIYGYDHGDNSIKSIAEKLMITFYGDETCARITGDKFVILAKYNKNFHDKFINMLSEMLRDYESNIHRINFDFNCGFYIVKNRKENISSMIEKANLAWSYSKKENNNCNYKYYNDELIETVLKEEFIISSMRQALDNDEFIIYMQPKMDLVNKKICGAEALVRWISPKLGFMPPDEFIPIFEKNGFIVELDFYVLEEMLKYLKERIDNNKSIFTVSINQSRETLRSCGYIKRLENTINKYSIPKELLELEVTESVLVLNYSELYKIIDEVRSLGIKVAIDDFGAGYSSLNLLKDVNIDILKLDKSFLYDNEVTAKGKTIITSIIDMSKKLDIEVVCEGVEVKEQSDILVEVGCTTAQGYYYGRPMTIMDFDENLKDK